MRAVYLLVARQQAGRDFAIFTELQAAMQRIALDRRPGPGTKHGPRNHRTGERDIQTRQYADCQRGAVGNGIADTCAKRAVTAKALDGESKKAMGWVSIALLRRDYIFELKQIGPPICLAPTPNPVSERRSRTHQILWQAASTSC